MKPSIKARAVCGRLVEEVLKEAAERTRTGSFWASTTDSLRCRSVIPLPIRSCRERSAACWRCVTNLEYWKSRTTSYLAKELLSIVALWAHSRNA